MPTEKNFAAKLRKAEIAEQLYQKALNAVWLWNRRDEPFESTRPRCLPVHGTPTLPPKWRQVNILHVR